MNVSGEFYPIVNTMVLIKDTVNNKLIKPYPYTSYPYTDENGTVQHEQVNNTDHYYRIIYLLQKYEINSPDDSIIFDIPSKYVNVTLKYRINDIEYPIQGEAVRIHNKILQSVGISNSTNENGSTTFILPVAAPGDRQR